MRRLGIAEIPIREVMLRRHIRRIGEHLASDILDNRPHVGQFRGERDAAGQLQLQAVRSGTPDEIILWFDDEQRMALFDRQDIQEILRHAIRGLDDIGERLIKI